MVVYTLTLYLGIRGRWISEFKTSQVHIMSFRTVRLHSETLFKKNKPQPLADKGRQIPVS